MSVRRVRGRNKLRTALIPRVLKLSEKKQLGRSYPENVENPMLAPQDFYVRQSGRVFELQNKISGYDPQIYSGTLLLL